MVAHVIERELGYSPEQLFVLVADVEQYPDFVPWWAAAKVQSRDETSYVTEQIVRFPFMTQRFLSHTALLPHERIVVTSDDKKFRHLEIAWQFTPLGIGASHVRLDFNLEPAIRIPARLADAFSVEAMRRFVHVFEERAHKVYGPPAVLPGHG